MFFSVIALYLCTPMVSVATSTARTRCTISQETQKPLFYHTLIDTNVRHVQEWAHTCEGVCAKFDRRMTKTQNPLVLIFTSLSFEHQKCPLSFKWDSILQETLGITPDLNHLQHTAFFTLTSAGACIHARLHYAAFSPQLVQVRMNRRACRHKSKKCRADYLER